MASPFDAVVQLPLPYIRSLSHPADTFSPILPEATDEPLTSNGCHWCGEPIDPDAWDGGVRFCCKECALSDGGKL